MEKVFFEIAQRRNIREEMVLETLNECQQSVNLFMVIFSKSNGFRVSAHARLPEKLSKKKQPSRDWELAALSLYLDESNAILSNDKDFWGSGVPVWTIWSMRVYLEKEALSDSIGGR